MNCWCRAGSSSFRSNSTRSVYGSSRSRVCGGAQAAGIQGGGDALLLQPAQERLGKVRLEGRFAAREGHAAAGFLVIGPVLAAVRPAVPPPSRSSQRFERAGGTGLGALPAALACSQRSRSMTRPSAVIVRQPFGQVFTQVWQPMQRTENHCVCSAAWRGSRGCGTRRSAADSP